MSLRSTAENVFALDQAGRENAASLLAAPEKKKHRRNAEETKKRILASAEHEFASKGFDGTRLATIANAAEVQQALIHHYFSDKAGLYREVIAQNLGAMSEQGWTILDRLAVPTGRPKIREIADAFVGMIVEFYASHGAILSILRHETSSVDDLALKVISEKVKPVFEAIVAYIEDMKRRKEIRANVDAHHLCVSALALATVSTQDERLLRGMWHVDVQSPEFLLKRKSEIVEMIVSRVEISANESSKTKAQATRQGLRQGSGGTLERRSASKRSRRRRG